MGKENICVFFAFLSSAKKMKKVEIIIDTPLHIVIYSKLHYCGVLC